MGAVHLSSLLDRYDGPECMVSGLTQDSRQVRPGMVFAALPGSKADGRAFIGAAVAAGAAVILAPAGTRGAMDIPGHVIVVERDDPRRDLATMAARYYRIQPDMVVAVTGTNGKTSTVHFAQQLWHSGNVKSASLGTLGVRGANFIKSGSMTTPDPVSLMAGLADLAASGITHLAMEASSHGLDQRRLDGVRVSAAGFTNLTRDHLDYHVDMPTYLAAKARLFSAVLRDGGTAVLNADDPACEPLAEICGRRGVRVWRYGENGTDLQLQSSAPLPHGQDLRLRVLGHEYNFRLPLVGRFQTMNMLCALGLVLADDETPARVASMVDACARLSGAPGRLQLVPGHADGAAVYVDYAHTPDALINVLNALRPHTSGRLVCVFGCGGDRDPGKRPVMGRIAADLADRVIVTDDNPRHEDAAAIRAAVMAGAGPGAVEIAGRRDAISSAIADLHEGDVLVIAGKGHEQGQIIKDRVEPFDDVGEAARIMKMNDGKAGKNAVR